MEFDLNTIFGLGGFVIAVLGVVGTGWWRMTVMVKDVKAESRQEIAEIRAMSSLALREVAEHRLHTAEEYLTKSGMREITEQIMGAIGGIGVQIAEMRGRIDRVFETPRGSRPAKTT